MCFLSDTAPWNVEKIHTKSILHLMHLVDPTQIFFPRNFIQQQLIEGSVLFQSSLIGIIDDQEIKMLWCPGFSQGDCIFSGTIQKYGLILGFQLSWIYWRAGEQIQECVQCSVPFTHLCRACFPPAVWHISHNFFPSCTTAQGTVVWLCTANNVIDKAMLLKYNNKLL